MRQVSIFIGVVAVLGLIGFGIVTANTSNQSPGADVAATPTAERPLLGNSSRDVVDFAPTPTRVTMPLANYIQSCFKEIDFMVGGGDTLGMDSWTALDWCEKQYGYRTYSQAAGEFVKQWRNRS